MRKSEGGAFQSLLGGDFGERTVDPFFLNFLPLLPGIENYDRPAMVASLDSEEAGRTVSSLTIFKNGQEKKVMLLPGLKSFREYCQEKKTRGMVIVVPELSLGPISPVAFDFLQDFFANIGRVANPDHYRVWIVERKQIFAPLKAADKISKTAVVQELGLCGAKYHRNQKHSFGWVEARPEKKRDVSEKDVNNDEKIRFFKDWLEKVVAYRGGRVLSSEELRKKLQHSRSMYFSLQRVTDGRGIVSEEQCGCLVRNSLNGDRETLLSCDGEQCYRDILSRDSKSSFRLGEEKTSGNCFDCGRERKAKACWAVLESFDNQKGIEVHYKTYCTNPNCSAYNPTKGTTWVDPARILNPEYVYYSLHKRESEDRKKAA